MRVKTPTSQDWNRFWKYDQISQSPKISWSKRRISQVIDPFLETGKSILDAGCGSGYFSKYFHDKGLKGVAVDHSLDALEITRRVTLGKVRTFQIDLIGENLSVKLGQRFDLIFTDGLLEHFAIDIQKRILENFKRALNPDGLILTFVPNRWSPWELIRPFYMPGIDEKPFTLRELTALHESCLLTIVKTGGINTFPFRLSPEKFLADKFGMLLYNIAKAKT